MAEHSTHRKRRALASFGLVVWGGPDTKVHHAHEVCHLFAAAAREASKRGSPTAAGTPLKTGNKGSKRDPPRTQSNNPAIEHTLIEARRERMYKSRQQFCDCVPSL